MIVVILILIKIRRMRWMGAEICLKECPSMHDSLRGFGLLGCVDSTVDSGWCVLVIGENLLCFVYFPVYSMVSSLVCGAL